MLDNLEKQFITVGDVQLHVVMAGNPEGEPIVLLHGFPEFWYGWRNQIPYLVEKGYRVIIPDQRGYNLSDKPKGVSNYKLDTLAQDIINLANVLGYEKINLVGHDWGAIVAWWVASRYPDRLTKLGILNVPHPSVMINQWSKGNISQWLKSWYIGFFQLPFIPETLVSLGDYSVFEQAIRQSGHPNTFTDDDIEAYRRAWSQPNAVTSMVNWYRAIARSGMDSSLRKKHRIIVPTLMLWGEQDQFLGKELAKPSIDLCLDGELVYFPNATHWIQHDASEAVNEELHRFFSQPVAELNT